MMTLADSGELQRQMWADYLERLRGLEGAEYDRAEQEAWQELQEALAAARGEPGPAAGAVE
jgi:hypothetical protein